MVHKTHIQSIVVNDRGMSTVLTSSVHSSEAAFLHEEKDICGGRITSSGRKNQHGILLVSFNHRLNLGCSSCNS